MPSDIRRPTTLLRRLARVIQPMAAKATFVPSILDYAYRATIKTVVFALGIVLLVATLKTIFGSQILIEPISVPRQLEEDGYAGTVVSRRLLEQLQVIGRSANDLYVGQGASGLQERIRFRSEDEHSLLATVQVPSSGLSLRSMAQAFREFLGFPESKISGEVTIKRAADTKAPLAYTIVLRFNSPTVQTAGPIEADSIDEAIRLSAPSVAERFDPVGLAAYHFKNRNWPETVRLADSLIAHDKREFRKHGLLLRGVHAFVHRKNDEAIVFFRRATEEDRRFAEAYNGWGAALASSGHYDAAMEKYQQTLKLDSSHYMAYLNRGTAFRAKGERDRAMEDFEQAVKLAPNFVFAFLNRGVAFFDRGETDRALQDFTHAIKLDPAFAPAFNNRGLVYLDRGEIDRAIQEFDRAIELDPTLAIAFAGRGRAYAAKGERERAFPNYDRALQVSPNNPAILNDRCYAKAIVGQLDSAIEDCNEALRLRPNHAPTLDSRGFAYLMLNALDEAIADYDAALKLDPKHAYPLFGRGVARHRKGDTEGGDADIAAAEKLKPGITGEMAKLGLQR